MDKMASRFFALCLAALTAAVSGLAAPVATAAAEASSAVVFMYHRFGEGDYPSTNIAIAQFEAHIAELGSGAYRPLPLPEIVAALIDGTALPERAIGLSADDAYLSVFTEAWPRLKAAGLPLTLFVATDPVDRGVRGYMNWDQIRQLRREGVTIGSQTASHLHMAAEGDGANLADIEKSNARFLAELGEAPQLIAYPYGEAGLDAMGIARRSGFVAGFGQHSGVASASDDLFYLPRFALNETYGDMARFRLAANALPLGAVDVTPPDPRIGKGDDNPPAIGFTVPAGAPAAKALGALSCFLSHSDRLELMRLGGDGGDVRIEVRTDEAMPRGRTRLNCTVPAGDGRWRWYGRQFTVIGQ